YPKGVTIITWTASDGVSTKSCQQKVMVNDIEPPIITCPANVTVGNNPGQCFATPPIAVATATDNCPGVTVAGVRSDGQSLATPYPVGVTTITWTATDSGGRTASCNQTIKINDVEHPKVTCPKDQI